MLRSYIFFRVIHYLAAGAAGAAAGFGPAGAAAPGAAGAAPGAAATSPSRMAYWQHAPPGGADRLLELAHLFVDCREAFFQTEKHDDARELLRKHGLEGADMIGLM